MFDFLRKKGAESEPEKEPESERKLQSHEMKCWKCGTINIRSNLFCTHCDRKIKQGGGEHSGSE